MSIYIGDTEVKDVYLGANKLKEVYVGDTKVFPTMKLTLLAEVIITWDNRVSDSGRYLIDHGRYANYGEVGYNKLLYEIKNYRSNSSYSMFRCYIGYGTTINQGIGMTNELFQYLAEGTSGQSYNASILRFNNSSGTGVYSGEFRVYGVS